MRIDVADDLSSVYVTALDVAICGISGREGGKLERGRRRRFRERSETPAALMCERNWGCRTRVVSVWIVTVAPVRSRAIHDLPAKLR